MNEELRIIAQSYCGMTPKDKGCKTYGEMQQKMADELEAVVKQYLISDINSKRELLLDFCEHVNKENQYNYIHESNVNNYLKSINNL